MADDVSHSTKESGKQQLYDAECRAFLCFDLAQLQNGGMLDGLT